MKTIDRLNWIYHEYHRSLYEHARLLDVFADCAMREARRMISDEILFFGRRAGQLRGEWSVRFSAFLRQISA